MAQQTAVEWFFKWFNDNQEATHKEYDEAFEQAKKMEKKQISDAYDWGLIDGAKNEEEGYYNGKDFYNGYYKES